MKHHLYWLGLAVILVTALSGHAAIEAPSLLTPAEGQSVTSHEITFEWSVVSGAVRYQLTLRKTPGVSEKDRVLLQLDTAETRLPVALDFTFLDLLGQELWWAIRAQDGQGLWGPWSAMRSFVYCLGGACSGGTVTPLSSGTHPISADAGDILIYAISVPPDQGLMVVRTRGGEGECFLGVRGPRAPWGTWDGASSSPSTFETLSVGHPEPGTWYVVVYGERSFSNVQLTIEYLPVPKTPVWTSDVGLFADLRAAAIISKGIDVELGPSIYYDGVGPGSRHQHHQLNAPGKSFIRCRFSLTDPSRDMCLTMYHLTSACTPEGVDRNLGYSPIDIVVNDTDADPFNNTDILVDKETGARIDDYDVATHYGYGYTYGFETDTFTIPSGQLRVGENTITIAAVDDPNRPETPYWFQALRLHPKGTARFQFASEAYSVDEGSSVILVRVLRMEDSTGPASVKYSVLSATATEGVDFELKAGSLDFEDGQESGLIPIRVLEDDVHEGPETFTISLRDPSSDNVIGMPSVTQVTIVDNERPLRVVYVDANAPPGRDGQGWKTAFRDLQDGIRKASLPDANGVEVWVAQGTYRPDRGTGDRRMNFGLVNKVALYGGFSGIETRRDQRDPVRFETVLSGDLRGDDRPEFGNTEDNSFHVVSAEGVNATAVLDGFRICAGHTDAGYVGERTQGGGLSCVNASPTIRRCHIALNWGGEGAGAYAGYFSYPIFEGCRFTSNLAEYPNVGGGGLASLMSSPLLVNCTLTGNRTRAWGGGLFSWDSSPVLIHCTVLANSLLLPAYRAGNLYALCGIYPTRPVLINSAIALGGGRLGPEIWLQGNARLLLDHSYVEGGWGQILADPAHNARVEQGSGNLTGAEVRAFPLTPDGHIRAGAALIGAGSPVPGILTDIDGDPSGPEKVDIGADQFVDTNADGLPDWWEARYFGSTVAALPEADPDGDGLANIQEYGLYSSHPARPPIRVDPLAGNDLGPGIQGAPIRTIQAALELACDGDTVYLEPGTYAGVGNRDLDMRGKAVVVRGSGPDTTSLDCQYSGFAVRCDSGEMAGTALVGLTITHAQAETGGAIQCYGSGPQIRNCHLVDNSPILNRLRHTTILQDGDSFDFLTGTRGHLDGGDMYFFRGEFLVDRQGQGAIHDMGPVQLVRVRSIPESVYLNANAGVGGVEVAIGHTYVLRPSEVCAVLLEVKAAESSQVTIDWVVIDDGDKWPSSYLGGAIDARGSLLTLEDCRIADNGPYGLFTQQGSVRILGEVELAGNDWLGDSLLLTGDGTLRLPRGTVLAIDDSIVRCSIWGQGRIEVALGASMTVEGRAVIDLGPPGQGGEIQCDGLLLARGQATITNADIHVTRASFENQAILSNNVITAQAGEPFGQFFVEDSVYITGNTIAADGDRYMDLDPAGLDSAATIQDDRIDVTITEGASTDRGGLFELRGREGLVSPGGTGRVDGLLCRVASVPPFDTTSWTLNRLELVEGAKLNLTNRFDFGNGGASEVLYVRDLVLRPGAVLNLGYNRLYYERLTGDPNAVTSIPVLGFSLSEISFEDQVEFDARVSTMGGLEHVRRLPAEAVADLIRDRSPSGVMEMRNILGLHPDKVFQARAKGLFAKASEDKILVRFEYLFDCPSGELIVYLTDVPEFMGTDNPDWDRHYVLAGRVPQPPQGRPGAMGSGRFGMFEKEVSRGGLDFTRGVRIELELVGPKDTRVLIDNWDPLVQPNPHYCWDLVWPNSTVDAFDFLAVMSESGRRSDEVTSVSGTPIGSYIEGFFCRDGYVTAMDAMAANWYICGLGCSAADPIKALFWPGPADRSILYGQTAVSGKATTDSICSSASVVMVGKRYSAVEGLRSDDFLEERLYGMDTNGAIVPCTDSLGTTQLNVRLVKGQDGELYTVHLDRGLVKLSGDQSVISVGAFPLASEPRYQRRASAYVGVQPREGGVAGLPILDVAFDLSGDVYVVPVVVSPDGNAPYVAAARLSPSSAGPSGPWTVAQLYVPGMQANDNIHLDGLQEIEIDAQGQVYVLNVTRLNQSDTLLVYDVKTGQETARHCLASLGIESPGAMHVSIDSQVLYLSGTGTRLSAASACVFGLPLKALHLQPVDPHEVVPIEILGMGQVTGMTEDQVTGTMWVAGVALQAIPAAFDSTTMLDILNRPPFYSACVASFPRSQQGPVQARPLSGPGCDLVLPLAIEWMGARP